MATQSPACRCPEIEDKDAGDENAPLFGAGFLRGDRCVHGEGSQTVGLRLRSRSDLACTESAQKRKRRRAVRGKQSPLLGPSPNLWPRRPKVHEGWDTSLLYQFNKLTEWRPTRCVPNGWTSPFTWNRKAPTIFILPHEWSSIGWENSMRLGTPLFLQTFLCPQREMEVGAALGLPGLLGHLGTRVILTLPVFLTYK